MQTVTLARHAMATRYELVLHGDDAVALRAAGEEALDEVDRLESQLSLYRPGSEIARLNARAAHEPVRVTPEVFQLLRHAQQLHAETAGAFDITIAPLVRCWGFMGGNRSRQFSSREPTPNPSQEGSGLAGAQRQFPSWEGSGVGWPTETKRMPSAEELAAARAVVGMNLVQLDERNLTIRFTRDGVMLDLGAIGKGHAVERAANLLREAGVTSALIHGGTSSVCAIGAPPDGEFWKVAVSTSPDLERRTSIRRDDSVGVQALACSAGRLKPELQQAGPKAGAPIATTTIPLRDEAMSVSAIWGKSFEAGGRVFGHVIDPRTGRPVAGAVLAAVVLPSATETDALSTALLTLGSAGHAQIAQLRPDMRTLLVARDGDELRVESRGIDTRSSPTICPLKIQS